MKKILWLDTETTGLDPEKHGLIEIAGIVEIDFDVKQEFDIKISPFTDDIIDEGAARLHGFQLVDMFEAQIKTYQSPKLGYEAFKFVLDKYVDKFDRNDKFIVAGYNTEFDVSFLEAFFKKFGDNYLFSYIQGPVDILAVCRYMSLFGILKTANHKLETICKEMYITLDAHNPMSDIRATREIALKIKELFKEKIQ